MAEKIGAKNYFECSALRNEGVKEIFKVRVNWSLKSIFYCLNKEVVVGNYVLDRNLHLYILFSPSDCSSATICGPEEYQIYYLTVRKCIKVGQPRTTEELIESISLEWLFYWEIFWRWYKFSSYVLLQSRFFWFPIFTGYFWCFFRS